MNYAAVNRSPPFHSMSTDRFTDFFEGEGVRLLPLRTIDIRPEREKNFVESTVARIRIYDGRHYYVRFCNVDEDEYVRLPDEIHTDEEAAAYAMVLLRMGGEP